MSHISLTGGKTLSGTITVNSSKNAAVALVMGSLINRGSTTLHNVPQIEEIRRLLEVLESIGVSIVTTGRTITLTPPQKLTLGTLDKEAGKKTRSIIFLLGTLAGRMENYKIPQAGGCRLGSRTTAPHLYALEAFGMTFIDTTDAFVTTAKDLHPADVVLYETGDTVTENALFVAAQQKGISTIRFASSNYMVQEVCFFLEKCGVQIDGIGTSTLTVHGNGPIDCNVEYTVGEDPIEAMTFLSLAIVTNSTITVARAPIDFLELELLKLEKMGLQYTRSATYTAQNGRMRLVDITIKPSTLTALQEKIHPLPYPGINIDNLPFFVPIATKATGRTLIHDWVYDNRIIYLTELSRLGANVTLLDPHRLYVDGPTTLKGTEMVCPPALRPSVIVLVAMLAAQGKSILRQTYHIERGYENLVPRLQSLGADIEVVKD